MLGNAPDTVDTQRLKASNRSPVLDALEQVVEGARDGTIPEFACLLTETQPLVEHVLRRGGLRSVSTREVNRELRGMEGVRPVVDDQRRIGPGKAIAFTKGSLFGGYLWRLGDVTSNGDDLTKLSNTDLVLVWRHRNNPKPYKPSVSIASAGNVTPFPTTRQRAAMTDIPSLPEGEDDVI
jgi:hypothetical protein